MSRFFLSILLILAFPLHIFATVNISSLLPNPLWDDTLGEYIELRNTGCSSVDISGYSLSDLSGKTYILPSGTNIDSHTNKSFPYSETKIALNNSGNESVYLKDKNWTLIDSYNYSGTQRDNVILSISLTDDTCSAPPDTNTGTIDQTGSLTETGTLSSTGSVNQTNTWEISTGVLMGTGSADFSSGSTFTGTMTETGNILTGSWVYTLSGVEISTGSISHSERTDTGSLLSSWTTSTWLVDTGVIFTGSSITTPTETGALTPIEMYYSDSDTNGKIDTLEIIYPYSLSGTVSIDRIALSSNTWWLFSHRINTETGYILSWALSGNVLILHLLEWDIEKSSLKINNTTTSDLRLKSTDDLGFRSIGWQISEDFLLTKSFSEYKKVYRKSSSQVPISGGVTWDLETSTGTTEISWTGSLTGSVLSWSTASGAPLSWAYFRFPEIVPTLQSPTNATLSWDTFTCSMSECRINITLEPLFSSGFLMREYLCYFSTGWELTPDTDCNPTTWYPSRSWSITIELREKAHTGNLATKILPIEWNVISTISPVNTLPPWAPDTGKPVAIMELDNKWKEYYFQDGDTSLICYTYTCSVNFTAEHSYDPEWSSISFLWIYGQNDIKVSKDPWGRKYGLWDHVITLRVIDSAGNYDQIDYHIHVVWPKPKEKEEEKPTKTKKKKEKISASIEPEKKKYKKIKMAFFSPPTIVLQGRTGTKKSEELYICEYKKKKLCSMNFTLSGTTKWYEYAWQLDGEELHRGKNPKSWKLTPGNHTVTLLSYYKWWDGEISRTDFHIKVIPEPKKPKKAKKTKVKKPKKPKKTQSLSIIPEANAGDKIPWETTSNTPLAFLIFMGGIGMGYMTRKKKLLR